MMPKGHLIFKIHSESLLIRDKTMMWQQGKENQLTPKTLFKEETLDMFLLKTETTDRCLLLLL